MGIPIQMIHIHYQATFLHLLDSDDRTPLYRVKVCADAPQLEMLPVDPDGSPSHHQHQQPSGLCTAAFKKLSFEVSLSIRGRPLLLRREGGFSRAYYFDRPDSAARLSWLADGALTGDFKLVDQNATVLARFRNKLFSLSEVGSFELVGAMDDQLKDEIVITGLAVLVMVQSLNLATMVLIADSP